MATTEAKNPILIPSDPSHPALAVIPLPGKEPTFADLTADLATAELEYGAIGADAKAASAKRSTVAVQTIKAAFGEKLPVSDVRANLLAAGVLKGTVSKIATILDALADGVLVPADIKSLNGAYTTVTKVKAAAAVSLTTAAGAPASVVSATAPAAKVTITPEEALKIIIDFIKAEKDGDKAFKLAGEWMSKVTTEIADAVKDIEDDE